MRKQRFPWQEELAIIDRTMKAISGISDPEELVGAYWQGIGELIAINDYVAVSRRNVEPPYYLITRSSRFAEPFNPWTQRDQLPQLTGGILGAIAYGNKPVVIEDLPSVLAEEDPAYFYLQGFQSLIALPQYDAGEALNVTMSLLPAGMELNHSLIPMMHWQSGLFGRGTQNLVLRNQLSGALAALDRELQVVGDIQRSLLPDELPAIPGYELASHYETSSRAGGDYYDFFPLDRGSWGLFIADVSGHGTPAAVLMAITHAIAHSDPAAHTPPATLLAHLNEKLASVYTRGDTFVTAFYATLDPAARRLTYSRAGHNPPRLARGDRVISLDEIGTLPLGIMTGQKYDEATVTLESGDLLLLYTDGIIEAMAPADEGKGQEIFGVERLDRSLLACGDESPDRCIERIRSAVCHFSGHCATGDDQTLIAMRVL